MFEGNDFARIIGPIMFVEMDAAAFVILSVSTRMIGKSGTTSAKMEITSVALLALADATESEVFSCTLT